MEKQNQGSYRVQSSSSARGARAPQKGVASGSGGIINRLYAMGTRQDQEDSSNVVTSLLKVFTLDV